MTIAIKKILLLLLACLATACQYFLDEKPDQKLVVPATVADVQALLDQPYFLNGRDPGSGEVSAGDYYLTDADWASLSQEEYRRLYTWQPDNLYAPRSNEWADSYRMVQYANTALETLSRITPGAAGQVQWNTAKGHALFLRAKAFLQVAFIWAPAYDENTAATDLGIPLRLEPDFTAPSVRASVQETYAQIISDLEQAAGLLPVTPLHTVRPSKPAAYALLARTCLAMRRYEQVAAYADSSLQLYGALLDYNTLDPAAPYPLPRFNPEVLQESFIPVPAPLSSGIAKIDPTLYASYAPDDLRKTLFFHDNGDGTYAFRGSYEGGGNLFSGIATDEVYLLRAEAYARQGKVVQAMEDLNTLLAKRWKTGTFVPFAAATAPEALQLILTERRKELLLRGLRWMELKRLNKEGAGIALTRTVNGQVYTLPPNDPRFALPIPEDVIALSGMPQNPR